MTLEATERLKLRILLQFHVCCVLAETAKQIKLVFKIKVTLDYGYNVIRGFGCFPK